VAGTSRNHRKDSFHTKTYMDSSTASSGFNKPDKDFMGFMDLQDLEMDTKIVQASLAVVPSFPKVNMLGDFLTSSPGSPFLVTAQDPYLFTTHSSTLCAPRFLAA
jgi:hypothetical protein